MAVVPDHDAADDAARFTDQHVGARRGFSKPKIGGGVAIARHQIADAL